MTFTNRPKNVLTRREFLALAGMAALAACAPGSLAGLKGSDYGRPAEGGGTGDDWPRSTAAEQGMDQGGIDAMLEKIRAEKLPTHSFLLARNGFLVAEHYFEPFTRDWLHVQRSTVKSIVSTLAGIAIGEGLIESVEQKALDFFPEMRGGKIDPAMEEVRIRHLLTMTIGAPDPLFPGPDRKGVNWVDEFFKQKIACAPGECFLYNSGGPHLLAAILQRVTGKAPEDYLREKLFGPLGITDFTWLKDGAGVNYGNAWMELRPLDMLKFGMLFLNDGVWEGRQVVPRGWTAEATALHVETVGLMNSAEDFGYGYNWWMNDFGGYSAHGAGGQYIFMVPEANIVAVFTGGYEGKSFPAQHELMKEYVIAGVK